MYFVRISSTPNDHQVYNYSLVVCIFNDVCIIREMVKGGYTPGFLVMWGYRKNMGAGRARAGMTPAAHAKHAHTHIYSLVEYM